MEVSKYLETGGDPNRVSADGYSLAQHALEGEFHKEYYYRIRPTQHCCEFLRMMKAYGLDPNTEHGPFFLLNSCGFPEEAALLLEWGVDLDNRDLHGCTPLYYCLNKVRGLALARVFLANGADLALTNAAGDDVEAYARRMAAGFEHEVSRNRFLAAADFIAEVKRAGSWKAYLKAPRVELVRLRSLCNRGRAAPPPDPILQRLFANVAASTNKPARTRRPLPNGVFWHVLQFWRTDRDD